MTQCEKIIHYMQAFGEISQRGAYTNGCTRLAARIADIKAKGYLIDTEIRSVKNMDGSASRVAFYRLVEAAK